MQTGLARKGHLWAVSLFAATANGRGRSHSGVITAVKAERLEMAAHSLSRVWLVWLAHEATQIMTVHVTGATKVSPKVSHRVPQYIGSTLDPGSILRFNDQETANSKGQAQVGSQDRKCKMVLHRDFVGAGGAELAIARSEPGIGCAASCIETPLPCHITNMAKWIAVNTFN